MNISLKLKYAFYGIIASASAITLATQAAGPDGVFGDYFAKMVLDCPVDNVIVGFNNTGDYGMRKCRTLQDIFLSVFGSSTAPSGQAMVGFDASGNPKYGSVNWINSGSNISYTGGNIAVGTIAPNASLEVKRTTADGNFAAWIDGTQSTNYGIGVNIANTGTTLAVANFMSNYTSRLFIRADGNIGIGTTSPTAKLEVTGNITADTPTLSGHLATKGYVDAQVVSAAGGVTACYKPITPGIGAHPTCATGYTRIYSVYGTPVGSSMCRIYFENSLTGFRHYMLGDIYLWYDSTYNGSTGISTWSLYDGDDSPLAYIQDDYVMATPTSVFNALNSTHNGNITAASASVSIGGGTTFTAQSCTFGYAVCCQ